MDKIVKSISHAFIVNALSSFYMDEKIVVKTGSVLLQKIKKMPFSIRTMIYASTFIFEWVGIFYGGCPFSCQKIEQQQKMLGQVEECDWDPLKKFLKFYQKLSLFTYYSLLAELK